jgi:hypothetical protein
LGSTKLDGEFEANWVCRTLFGEQKVTTADRERHCSINRKGGEIKGAGGKDRGNNFPLRVKEQAIRLNLQTS